MNELFKTEAFTRLAQGTIAGAVKSATFADERILATNLKFLSPDRSLVPLASVFFIDSIFLSVHQSFQQVIGHF